jgi:hypothetical protein
MLIEWLVIGQDRDGRIVKLIARGPKDAEEMRLAADTHLFGEARRAAMREGLTDPELKTIDVKPNAQRTDAELGTPPLAPGCTPFDVLMYVPKANQQLDL